MVTDILNVTKSLLVTTKSTVISYAMEQLLRYIYR